jgi:hypothetical protein
LTTLKTFRHLRWIYPRDCELSCQVECTQRCWNTRSKASAGFDPMSDILVILETVGIITKGFHSLGLGRKDSGSTTFDRGQTQPALTGTMCVLRWVDTWGRIKAPENSKSERLMMSADGCKGIDGRTRTQIGSGSPLERVRATRVGDSWRPGRVASIEKRRSQM